MKKLFGTLLFSVLLLAACNSSELSISEIEVIPTNLQYKIDTDSTLQMINENEKTFYVVYQSKGSVTSDLETIDDTLIIKLEHELEKNNEAKQYVYKLTIDSNHKAVEVHIDGERVPFDNVTTL